MDDQDYFGVDNRYVKELQPGDFDSLASWVIKSEKHPATGIVLYYAPWCPHCKHASGPFLEAAKKCGFCNFYAFNCEKHKAHVSKIRSDMPNLIRGYPSIIVYQNGSPLEVYSGERTADGFTQRCMKLCDGKSCKS